MPTSARHLGIDPPDTVGNSGMDRRGCGVVHWDVSDACWEAVTAMVSVRYIVDDIDAAVGFYVGGLGFDVEFHPGPGFAALTRGSLRLLLSTPGGGGGAGAAMPDGRVPQPGGWNRIQIEVDDLDAEVAALRRDGARFRNAVVHGRGGTQILLEDPAGNPIELFEPIR